MATPSSPQPCTLSPIVRLTDPQGNTIYVGEWSPPPGENPFLTGRHGHGEEYEMRGEFNRLVYKGEWVRGKRQGMGLEVDLTTKPWLVHPIEGVVYDGEWLDDEPHGFGKALVTDNLFYKGEFVRGLREGQGMLYTHDGKELKTDNIIYEGGWLGGKRHGKGKSYRRTYYYHNGRVDYDGEFVDDLHEGSGVLYAHGTRTVLYSGEWVGGKMSGKGRSSGLKLGIYKKNDYDEFDYDGEWLNGKPHGNGILYTHGTTHIVYEGGFRFGVKHGKGKRYAFTNTTYYAHGKIDYVGEFKNDGSDGLGTVTIHGDDAVVYEGEFKDGLADGQGTWYRVYYYRGCYHSMRQYEGVFAEGVLDGNGTEFYPDGKTVKYDGGWSQGSYRGEGKLNYSDGSLCFKGTFNSLNARMYEMLLWFHNK